MRGAGIKKFSPATVLAGALSVVLLAICIWREQLHGQRREEANLKESALHAELVDSRNRLEHAESEIASLGRAISERELDRLNQQDRITNLEAQRDHLRGETDRRGRQIQQVEETVSILQAELEQALQRALGLEAQPALLEGELRQARARIAEMNRQLDNQAAIMAEIPEAYQFSGTSSDGQVFALEGKPIDPGNLPYPVFLCDAGGPVLNGWISRMEDDFLIGHVRDWHRPASALVKGKKVFILPGTNNEPDH